MFSSFILISFGLNLDLSLFETSSANFLLDSDNSCLWSFGMIRVCPLLRGFISKIAIESLFWAILKDFCSPEIIEHIMHCPPRWVSSFCLMKFSNS